MRHPRHPSSLHQRAARCHRHHHRCPSGIRHRHPRHHTPHCGTTFPSAPTGQACARLRLWHRHIGHCGLTFRSLIRGGLRHRRVECEQHHAQLPSQQHRQLSSLSWRCPGAQWSARHIRHRSRQHQPQYTHRRHRSACCMPAEAGRCPCSPSLPS